MTSVSFHRAKCIFLCNFLYLKLCAKFCTFRIIRYTARTRVMKIELGKSKNIQYSTCISMRTVGTSVSGDTLTLVHIVCCSVYIQISPVLWHLLIIGSIVVYMMSCFLHHPQYTISNNLIIPCSPYVFYRT